MTKKEQRVICDVCGGTGQLSNFKVGSRFFSPMINALSVQVPVIGDSEKNQTGDSSTSKKRKIILTKKCLTKL